MGLPGCVAKHLGDIIQMPSVLSKSSTNQAVGLFSMHHNRGNSGVVGAHNSLCQIWRDPVAGHQLMVGSPVIAIAGIILRIYDAKIAVWPYVQAYPFASLQDNLGAPDENRVLGGFF